MKKNVIVSLADSNYFNLLNELVESIKSFKESENTAISILDAGLTKDQKNILKEKVDEIKSAEWDIEVPAFKTKGKEWLKSQVSRAFLPNYFPNYEKYLWIDCDAWVNDWKTVELYFKACSNNKLGITQTLGPGYKIMSKVNWLLGKFAIIKSQNFKHAISSKIGLESTIISLVNKPQILRLGGLEVSKINKALKTKLKFNRKNKKIIVPGQGKVHYSPGIPIRLNVKKPNINEAFMLIKKRKLSDKNYYYLSKRKNLKEAAKKLYKTLRMIKKKKFKSIAVEKIPSVGFGEVINDRLIRASKF